MLIQGWCSNCNTGFTKKSTVFDGEESGCPYCGHECFKVEKIYSQNPFGVSEEKFGFGIKDLFSKRWCNYILSPLT